MPMIVSRDETYTLTEEEAFELLEERAQGIAAIAELEMLNLGFDDLQKENREYKAIADNLMFENISFRNQIQRLEGIISRYEDLTENLLSDLEREPEHKVHVWNTKPLISS